MLIADDDTDLREALEELLAGCGFQPIPVGSGEEALTVLGVKPVDLVLMDLHKPGLSGLETLKLTRDVSIFVPCILLTAHATPEVLQQALALRAFTVLSKPVNPGVVATTVRRALHTRPRAS